MPYLSLREAESQLEAHDANGSVLYADAALFECVGRNFHSKFD